MLVNPRIAMREKKILEIKSKYDKYNWLQDVYPDVAFLRVLFALYKYN